MLILIPLLNATQMKKQILLAASLLLLLGPAQGQKNTYNTGYGILVNMSYAFQVPGGDLLDRFGNNTNVAIGVDYISKEQNWIIGLEGQYLFGSQVKENVLQNLLTPDGFLIGNDRAYADISLRQRGFYIGGVVGRLIAFSDTRRRTGLRITVGSGLLQHKIRVQEDPARFVPQVADDYKKGYDRLTNGLAFTQFVGYQMLSENKRLNLFAGIEAMQAFTKSRRDFDFDTRMKDERSRLDLLFGVRVGLVLPFYPGQDPREVWY